MPVHLTFVILAAMIRDCILELVDVKALCVLHTLPE